MKTKLLIVCLLIIGSVFAVEQSRSLDQNGKNIEQEFLKELATLPKERHFEVYMQAARNFYTYKVYDKSVEYFTKALSAETKYSKKEPHLRLLQIHYLNKDFTSLQSQLDVSKKYFSKNSKENDSDTASLLNFYEMKLPKNAQQVSKNSASGGLQTMQLDHNFYALFGQGKYQEAFEMLDKNKITREQIAHQLSEFDLLNMLVNKEESKRTDLLCAKMANKYRDSYSYPVLLCQTLIKYQESNAVSKDDLQKLSQYIMEFSQSKKFVIDAVKRL